MQRKSGRSLRRIAILEGLRGWLACWVMVSHIMLYCAFPLGQMSRSPFLRYFLHMPEMGRTAVWLFMILSGFVNFYLMDMKREKYHVYLTRRFLRLYPVFFILFLLSIPVTYYNMDTLSHVTWAKDQWVHIQWMVTQTAFQYFYPNVIAHLTLLQGLVPTWAWPRTTDAFLGVNWSISPEWQFYLLVPLLFAWASRKNGLIWMGLLACACFFSPASRFIRSFENDNPSLLILNFHLFYVGIASYYLYRQFILKPEGPVQHLSRLQLTLLGFIALFLAGWDMSLLLWGAIFLLTYFAETHPSDVPVQKAAAIFTNRVSQYLGKISYSIYLFHWLALMIVLRVIYLIDPQITSVHALLWMFPGVIGLTILVSDQLNRWVEEPCIRFGKRLFHEQVK